MMFERAFLLETYISQQAHVVSLERQSDILQMVGQTFGVAATQNMCQDSQLVPVGVVLETLKNDGDPMLGEDEVAEVVCSSTNLKCRDRFDLETLISIVSSYWSSRRRRHLPRRRGRPFAAWPICGRRGPRHRAPGEGRGWREAAPS